MKRHPALHDLSRDHHLFLLHCRAIRWLITGDPRAASLSETLAGFLAVWEEAILPHQEEEEEQLLPLYRRSPSAMQAQHEARMVADHAWLTERIAALRRAPEEDLLELLEAIGQSLYAHIRFEERVVFPHLEAVMSSEDLASFHAASHSLRQQQRPHALGPRSEG